MKNLEIATYVLLALDLVFTFLSILVSLILLIVTFYLISKVKKHDKNLAKKLNYVGIAILALDVIFLIAFVALGYLYVSNVITAANATYP